MPDWLEALLNVATFAGIAILAVPVWSLNLRKRKLSEVRDALEARGQGDLRGRLRKILKDRRERDVADWRPIDEACLRVGYTLLLGSAGLRALAPFFA